MDQQAASSANSCNNMLHLIQALIGSREQVIYLELRADFSF